MESCWPNLAGGVVQNLWSGRTNAYFPEQRRLLRRVEPTENDQHHPRCHIGLQETRRQPIHQEPIRSRKKKVKTSVTQYVDGQPVDGCTPFV